MEDFEGFDNEIGLPTGMNIIPNVIHFIIWNDEISFMEAICILSAVVNQNQVQLYIHTDRELSGKYWNLLLGVNRFRMALQVLSLDRPKDVFGQQLNSSWKDIHGSDVARLQILMRHGGIFLETDVFLVQSLDEFRKFEMSLGWQPGNYLANQAIVAHKNARFLHKWYDSYKNNYKSGKFSYNSREYPTLEILTKQPHLIRRMTSRFCENYLREYLLLEDSDTWRDHYVIHVSLDRPNSSESKDFSRIVVKANATTTSAVFNETNIDDYNCTLRQMVLSVMGYLFKSPIIESYPEFEVDYEA